MGERFAYDFSGVAVHTDATAAESARAVNALAYTVGPDIAFAAGRYQPHTAAGRRLIAHELAHVVQQRGGPASSAAAIVIGVQTRRQRKKPEPLARRSALEERQVPHRTAEAGPILNRADPDATGYVTRLGKVEKTGIQFFPTNVTDTQVGPVTVQGGLFNAGASRLSVIIGQNLTPRQLARQLVPLWNTATPFTPPGGGAPVPVTPITELQLAQALLVYNRTYLPVPTMTNWRAGLRFPLPVEVDALTGIATLHGMVIQQLASGFDPTWLPKLDSRATAVTAVPAATLRADVTAFLARETTALARGIHLGARAMTNALAERPFVREVFRQLGPASFDVALAFMDNLVNREVSVLAAQRDGRRHSHRDQGGVGRRAGRAFGDTTDES